MGLIPWDIIELGDNLEFVSKLNSLLEIDPEFTQKIIDTRFEVNEKYTKSNFIYMEEETGNYAGIIGILNGFIDNENYRICATYDDLGKLLKFDLLQLVDGKFTIYDKKR